MIRRATATDIPLIQHISNETWPVAYGKILSAHQLKYMLELIYSGPALEKQLQEGQEFFIITEDEIPVGFAAYSKHAQPAVYKLHKLYILPSTQGKGTGKKLLEFVIETIKANGATALLLNVNRHNPARRFYERMGFSIIDEQDIYIGNGYFMNDFIMQKTF